MNQYYPHIFEPIKVGNVTFKNRVFVPPMTNHLLQDTSTSPGEGYIAHRAKLAKNGAACVCFGNSIVKTSTTNPRSIFNLYDESGWKNWIKYVQAVHFYGAKASMEFSHFGHEAERSPGMTDAEAWGWGASDCIVTNTCGEMRIKAMDKEIMDKTADVYADYAEILHHLGFDVMIIHGGHKTLFENFLSPLANKRNDEFNGSLENRARFPMMVLDRIRERVGNKILIELRVSGSHFEPNGWDIDECIQYLHLIQDKIDIAHISAGAAREPHLRSICEPSGYMPPIPNVWLAEKIKKSGLKIPVATVGGFQAPELMESVLAEGKADIINVGRGFLADPEFLIKAQEGRSRDIRTCIRCLTCLDDFKDSHHLSCAVNPEFGREDVLKIVQTPAERRKKVAVIGAGPAGMEAAIQASKRGHNVVVYEKASNPGGMLHVADAMPFKYYLKSYKEYLISQFDQCSAEKHYGVDISADMLKEKGFDAVIIAVGGKAFIPPIKGVESDKVTTGLEALRHQEKIGRKVVIIGGGQIGCELALNCAMNGKEVTILEMASTLAKDEMRTNREELLYQLYKHKVTAYTDVMCTEISNDKVYYKDQNGEISYSSADTIILAAGMRRLEEKVQEFWDCAPEVRVIGDCAKIGNIRNAITEGYDAGQSI